MKKRKIFVDSDVVLSSLISNKGAAYFLLNKTVLEFYISNVSLMEIERGVEKLNLKLQDLVNLVRSKFKLVKLKVEKNKFQDYVFDPCDEHIVAGARQAKAKLILSYNVKDFNIIKLRADFKIIVKTPAQFLQHLRSLQ